MQLLSQLLASLTDDQRRTAYSLTQRAVKRGDVHGLKLLASFEIAGKNGPRQVADYAITEAGVAGIQRIISTSSAPAYKRRLKTPDEVQGMSEEELAALIEASRRPKRKRRSTTEKK